MMAGRCCITLCMLAVLANTGQSQLCYYNDTGNCTGFNFIASSAEVCCSVDAGSHRPTFHDGDTCMPCAAIFEFEPDSVEEALPGVTIHTTCDAEDYTLSAVLEESQKEVIEAIQNVLPTIPGVDYFRESGSRVRDKSLEELYEEFAEAFNTMTTETNYNNFVEAVSEIANAQRDACSGPNDTKPTTADIPQLISDFKLAFFGGDQKLQDARSVVGKMLCVQEQLSASKRKKRETSSCDCPVGGLDSGTFDCPCEFFTCLDEGDEFKPIMGFTNRDKFTCIAFLLDTTASMRDEIEAAKQIITDFVRHQEDENLELCYILVPFTDTESGHPDDSVGPITYANTERVMDLVDFIKDLNAIVVEGGGDGPEYAFDAILETLRYKDPYYNNLLALDEGSHIIVLTDATSKNAMLSTDIIAEAQGRVCIHFFLENYDHDYYMGSDPDYNFDAFDRIHEEISGTLVTSIDANSLKMFTTNFMAQPCDYVGVPSPTINTPGKRSAILTSRCSTFLVSTLTSSLLVLIGSSESSVPPVRVTRPDGSASTHEVVRQDLTAVSDTDPQAGEWTVCSENGLIELSVRPRYNLNTVVVYTIGDYVTSTPYTCVQKIAILTSQAPLMHSVNLNLVTAGGSVVQRIPMSICGESLIANINSALPLGEITYHFEGIDTLGVPFEYDTKKIATFIDGEHALTTLDGPSIEVQRDSAFTLHFELRSLSSVCNTSTTFIFSVESPGFRALIVPEQATVAPGNTIQFEVRPFIVSSSVQPGTSHLFTLTASSAYQTLTAIKTVITTAPPPPPTLPPDACGCQNGGTCVITISRGRERRRCLCPSEYGGAYCQVTL